MTLSNIKKIMISQKRQIIEDSLDKNHNFSKDLSIVNSKMKFFIRSIFQESLQNYKNDIVNSKYLQFEFFEINIFYMQKQLMKKNLFDTQHRDLDQIPTTPKKKSQFRQQIINQTPKIKYRYTIVEKPISSWMGKLFFFIWLTFMVGSALTTYQTKMYQLQNSVSLEISQCKKDYDSNKCQTPLKGIKQFCAQKERCLKSNLQDLIKVRTQGTLFFGQLIAQFFQGLGLPLIIVGLIYLIFGNKKSNEVKKEFVQYYP